MSDENTTPRRVAPEGSVPEDREPYAVSDREPDLAPMNAPEAGSGREPDAGPDRASDLAPADEPAPEAAPAVDRERDRGPDGDEDGNRDRSRDRDQNRVAEDTLLIDQHPQTAELPSPAPVATPSVAPVFPQAATAAGPVPAPQPGGLVTVRTGPRPGAIMLGLICLLVSAYTLARQTTDWRFDLSLAGPISIGALGTLLLLVGLVGLLTRRKC